MAHKLKKLIEKLCAEDCDLLEGVANNLLLMEDEEKNYIRAKLKILGGTDPDNDGDNDTDHPSETGE